MANTYYDYNNGSSGNSGLTPELPKATRGQAVNASTSGDTVFALDGVHVHESGHFIFDDYRDEVSYTYRGATFQPNAVETTYCARTSASLSSANNPFIMDGFVFDALDQTSYSLYFGEQSNGELLEIRLSNSEVKGGVTYALLCQDRAGTQRITNCKLSGSPTNGLFATTASLSSKGAQTIDIQGVELDGTRASGVIVGFDMVKVNDLVNTLDIKVKGVTGSLVATGTAAITGMNIKSVNPSITNNKITFDSTESSGTGFIGIVVQGQSVAQATNPIIAANDITFNCPDGYAISLGQTAADANVTGGEVSANKVTGVYSTTDTPHGYLMGQAVDGATMRGNVATKIYAPYLASKCTSGFIEGNLAYDCHGVSLYVKGCTDITVQDNTVAVVTDCTASADSGIAPIAVNKQTDGTKTLACSIKRNLVLIDDISKVQSLACVMLDNTATFENNTYVIPDTVSLSSNLFAVGNATLGSNAPNTTLAGWNALSATANGEGSITVTNDQIVQMPAAEITKLIATYKPSAGGTGEQSIISHNIIKH